MSANKTAKEPKYAKLFPNSVDILGTTWSIVMKKFDEDPYFKKNSANGFCSGPEKLICICDESTWPGSENESETFFINCMKHALRHEIVHAFFKESGLDSSCNVYENAWAKNEEMVDWIAGQGSKIYKTWEKTGCLEFQSPEQWMNEQTAKKEAKMDGRSCDY